MEETFEISGREAAVLRRYGLLAENLKRCSVRSYSFGEKILTEGAPIGMLYIVLDGKAKVGVAAPNGKNLIVCFYLSEGLLGEAELFSGMATAGTTVTALDNFCCIAVPTDCNRAYLNRNLSFTKIAAGELAKKLMKSTDNVTVNTLYSAEIRLCRYIRAALNGGYFRDVMTDVAYSVGISYRHLYRLMNTLCKQEILEKTKTGYRLLNKEKLEELCGQQGQGI